jgi:hypothetical protein
LRSDSTLGVPGLIGAVRAHRVVIANALGSGVLESAAWMGFLPRIAERLLGEKLILPSVATWWCGEQPALEYVLTHLDKLVIKPTYPNQRFEPVFGRNLDGEKRKRLIQRLRARPYAYVAQEHLSLSQAPVWRPHGALGFAAAPVAIRMYAITGASGTTVMPGGLARVAPDSSIDVVSTQRGGGSKDIWVLPDSVEDAGTPPATTRSPAARVRHDDIPSRLVENLYWLGRYTVRCEDKARLLRETIAARADDAVWTTAVGFCQDLGVCSVDGDLTACLRDWRGALLRCAAVCPRAIGARSMICSGACRNP